MKRNSPWTNGTETPRRSDKPNTTSSRSWHRMRRSEDFNSRCAAGFAELGPFVEKINLMAWLEEMVLRGWAVGRDVREPISRCGPEIDPALLDQFGTELLRD